MTTLVAGGEINVLYDSYSAERVRAAFTSDQKLCLVDGVPAKDAPHFRMPGDRPYPLTIIAVELEGTLEWPVFGLRRKGPIFDEVDGKTWRVHEERRDWRVATLRDDIAVAKNLFSSTRTPITDSSLDVVCD